MAELEVLLEKYPKSAWAEKSQFQSLEILYLLNRCVDIKDHYNKFLQGYPKSKYSNEMMVVVASCLENQGMLQEAFKMFQSLGNNYTYPSLLRMKIEAI